MPQDFDLQALHAALDARREALGLSWEAVGAALGVSAATLRGLGVRRAAEGDGVLRALAWLGRSPESFVPGRLAADDTWDTRLPAAAVAGSLRFDGPGLYAALEAARAARGLTWRDVAAASGVGSPAALTRLRAGGRVTFPEVMRGAGMARRACGAVRSGRRAVSGSADAGTDRPISGRNGRHLRSNHRNLPSNRPILRLNSGCWTPNRQILSSNEDN